MGGTAIISPQRASGPQCPKVEGLLNGTFGCQQLTEGKGGGEGGSGGGLSPCFPLGVIIEIDPV